MIMVYFSLRTTATGSTEYPQETDAAANNIDMTVFDLFDFFSIFPINLDYARVLG